MKRRNGTAMAALARRAPVMKDRRTPRGGQRNKQADLLMEHWCDRCGVTEGQDFCDLCDVGED